MRILDCLSFRCLVFSKVHIRDIDYTEKTLPSFFRVPCDQYRFFLIRKYELQSKIAKHDGV